MEDVMMAQELSDEQLEAVTGGHGFSNNFNGNFSHNGNGNFSHNGNNNGSDNGNTYFSANTSVSVSKSWVGCSLIGNGNTVLQGNSFGD